MEGESWRLGSPRGWADTLRRTLRSKALLEHVGMDGGVLDCCGSTKDAVSTVLTERPFRVTTYDLNGSLVADSHMDARTDAFVDAFGEEARRPDWVVTSPPYRPNKQQPARTMRTVPAIFLGGAALLQFFGGFASAAGETCNDVDFECATTSNVRDPAKDNVECTSTPYTCDETDCCMAGTVAEHSCSATGYQCTTAGKVVDAPNYVCTHKCTEVECCTGADSAFSCGDVDGGSNPYECQNIGSTLDGSKSGDFCTNDVCTDALCCGVSTHCGHYPTCTNAAKVLTPNTDLSAILCPVSGFCDDDDCCAFTCASTDYSSCPGSRLDDVVCTSNPCVDDVNTDSINDCCTPTVTCTDELYQCPAGEKRVGINSCPEAGQCTDPICCVKYDTTTITEARQMKTPRSRQHLTQYGTK